MRVLASNLARDLAACQRLEPKHKLNVCWHLPRWVSLRRGSTGDGVMQACPADKVSRRKMGNGMMVKLRMAYSTENVANSFLYW